MDDPGRPVPGSQSPNPLNPQELYQVLFEEAPDGIFLVDPSGMLSTVNHRMAELTGFSCEEFRAMTIDDLIPSEERARQPIRAEELRQGKRVTTERIVQCKGGHQLQVELTARMLPGGFVLGILRDISERKAAEEALRESEASFRQIVETSPIAIAFDTPDGRTGYFNPKLEQTIGYTIEEIPSMEEWFKTVYPDPVYREAVKTRWQEAMAAAIREGRVGDSMEVDITCRDSTVRTMEVFGASMGARNLAMFTDLTERKRAEEALRQNEERFRSILQHVPAIAIQGYRLDGTTTYWNKASERLYGYSQEEAVGRNLLELIIPEERRKSVQESMRRMRETGESIPSEELLLRRKDGSMVAVFSNHALVQLAGAEPELFCLDIDLTDRKLAEAEKDRLQAQLLQAQKMESVGRLAGGVAHDFNNMLTAILGHSQMAMAKCSPSEPIHSDLLAIEGAAFRSADLVRQLLAFARQQTVAPKVLDLNKTVGGMLKMLQRLIGEDIAVLWRPGGGLWPIRIDPTQIDQLLANLCVNARDAIDGVGTITIETQNRVLDGVWSQAHPGSSPGDYVMIVVSDNGCGMSREILDRLFEPFFTTKDVGKGTGLGLATVYGIVKQNEGFINVLSEPGVGSTFQIFLRRHLGGEIDLPAEQPGGVVRGNGETVLFVEDEPAILNIGRVMLEDLGYKVMTAHAPSEALRQAADPAAVIDLLITDVVMPEMNGRELARLLVRLRPGLKCLFASGYTADVIAHRGVLEEGVNFLGKPFSIEELARKVRDTLEGA